MAGDWIKMRKSLLGDPRVVRIMSALRADRFRTIGGLFSAWCLLDEQTEDGMLQGYTAEVFDEVVGLNGLAKAMQSVGWLVISPQGVAAPNFTEHNGKSAKRRDQENVRKMSARHADKLQTESALEKRREEKSDRKEEKRTEETKEDSTTAQCEKFARAEYSPDFQRFWDAYPTKRRLGKKQAYAAWQKAIKTADAEAIIGKAAEYAASDRGQGEYSCMPATWLNQGRWEDDPAAWQDDRQLTTERKPSDLPMTFGQLKEKNRNDVFERVFASGKVEAIFDAAERLNGDEGDRAE